MQRLTHKPAAPPSKSTHISTHDRQILFRHPWYNDSNNVLLRLFAPDSVTDVVGRGLYAQFALDACGIIAGNRWDGWLSESKDATTATGTGAIESTTILQKSSYYFHLPAQSVNAPYPIVPTFGTWRFPHDELPHSWKQITPAAPNPTASNKSFSPSNLTLALHERDVSCRITGYDEGTQVAHICPKKEDHWWGCNGMSRYNTGVSDTLHDLSNTLLLRSDLRSAFDRPKFTFVPKASSDFERPQLVLHLIEPSPLIESLYHNRELHDFRSSIQLLFARFAWTIFPLLHGFLTGGEPRRLLLVEGSADSVDEEEERRPRKKRQHPNHNPLVQSTKSLQDLSENLDSRNCIGKSSNTGSPSSPSGLSSTSHSSHPLDRDGASAAGNGVDVTLAQAWLARERLRSDPNRQWEKDKAWAKRVSRGDVTLSAEEARRWMEICGAEIQEE